MGSKVYDLDKELARLKEFDFEQKDQKGSLDKKGIDIEDFIFRNRVSLTFFLLSLVLIGIGVLFLKINSGSSEIEVLDDSLSEKAKEIVVEIAGAVETPGVYRLSFGSRVEDLLIVSGGLSADADRSWVQKTLNRAAKLTDGQKIYIPKIGEQTLAGSAKNSGGIKMYQEASSTSKSSLVNLNTASQKELEDLPGIGPVYAQSIIEHRPYSSVEELLSKKVLRADIYEKIKDKVTVD